MSWINILNGEGGTSVRAKINNAMSTLFGSLPVTQLWEVITGETKIKPTGDEDVVVGNMQATAAHINQVNADNVTVAEDLTLTDLAYTGIAGSSIPLGVDPNGKMVKGRMKMGIISTGTWSEQDVVFDVIFIRSENNYNYKLAAADANIGKGITVRKAAGATYEVDLEVVPGDVLLINAAASVGIKTSTQGAWITLKAFNDGTLSGWAVIMDSGNWTGYV